MSTETTVTPEEIAAMIARKDAEKEAEKAAKVAAKLAEKEAIKAAREAAKAEAKALKEAEKAEKAALKEAARAAKEAAKEAVEKRKSRKEDPNEFQNGVMRARGGTTARVWEAADAISKELGAPCSNRAIREWGESVGINEHTVKTQYSAWRKFHGLVRTATPATPATPAE